MKPDPVAWHGLPGQPFAYHAPLRASTPLDVRVSVPQNRVQTAYACHIWEASLLLSDAISAGEVDVRGKVVLELGAGAGLAGLVARRKGAAKVSGTGDHQPEHGKVNGCRYGGVQVILSEYEDECMLDDLRKNVACGLNEEQREGVQVIGHSWGDPTSLRELKEWVV